MKKYALLVGLLVIVGAYACKSTDPTKPSEDPTTEKPDTTDTNDDDPASVDAAFDPSKTAVENFGQLRVQGNRIVNAAGQNVQLRGMSLFWSQWMGQYYQPETVQWLATNWQATVVRAALAVEHDGYLDNPEREKAKVKAVIDGALAAGLYVIIDWHDHHAEDHLAEAKAFFGEMAQTYGSHPHIIYEPYNEPLNVSWTNVLKPYFEALIDTIRTHDPDNLIVCGTRQWSQRVDEAAYNPLDDPNVAYTLHYYAATHKQSLRDIALTALNKGVALMVTEYGTCEASGDGFFDKAETEKWWKFLDDHRISHCNWSVADKVEGTAALKPGAPGKGGWTDSQLTASGAFVRAHLRSKNPAE